MALKKNRFSVQANMVLSRAQAEAEKLNHNQVVPEHLLLGLIWEEQGAAFLVLKSLGADLARLEEELRENLKQINQKPGGKLELSEPTKKILRLSMESVMILDRPYLGTEHLLIGLMRTISSKVYPVLRQMGITHNKVLSKLKSMPFEEIDRTSREHSSSDIVNIPLDEKLNLIQLFLRISPVFWVLVGLTVVAGMAVYYQWIGTKISVFLFVTLGWILSLCLHEGGHALAAYWGGDRSIIRRGYLTLNPVRYTNKFMSVVLPIFYLMLGGLGMPGGAIYINYPMIQNKRIRSSVAFGGPIMTFLFTLVLVIPLLINFSPDFIYDHQAFWGAWAFLGFIQITALVINLLPVPGFDGFNLIMPYFPRFVIAKLRVIAPYAVLFIFLLLFQDTVIRRGFWFLVNLIASTLGIDFYLVTLGLDLYLFW